MGTIRYTDTIDLTAPTGLEMGEPSRSQLSRINEFRPLGVGERKASDCVVVPFLASHNLLNHSRGVWAPKALESMAATFAGMPLILNHEWHNAESSVGFIFDSALFYLNEAPEAIAKASDHWQVNRSILARDGFIGMALLGVVAADHAIVGDIEARRVHQVSTGVLTDGTLTCPHCKVDFDDYENCPHYIPFGMSQKMIDKYRSRGAELADYFVRGEVLESVELSFVVSGNYPGAAVLSEAG